MIEAGWSSAQIEDHLRQLPILSGPVRLWPLVGGLCNQSFVVADGQRRYVARIGFDIPLHGIVQSSVQASMRAASDLGISPPVRHAEPNLTVVDFLEGGPLRNADVHDARTLARVVARAKAMHEGSDAVAGALTYFSPFHAVRRYIHLGKEHNSRLISRPDELRDACDWLEGQVAPFVPVFTHNDVVPQNMMFDNDREVWLVDWDYGGFGHRMFDIAGIAANSDAAREIDEAILELYFGELTPECWREYMVFKAVISLREYMWGMAQELTSNLAPEAVAASMADNYPGRETGYMGYAELNRERFERSMVECQRLANAA